jgi:hypothetical protein
MQPNLPPAAGKPIDADELRWDLAGESPWPETQQVVSTALEALPTIADDLSAALILELLHALLNVRERGRSMARLVTAGLDVWHPRAAAEDRRRRLREFRRCAVRDGRA